MKERRGSKRRRGKEKIAAGAEGRVADGGKQEEANGGA